jgi:muramidase (phage lysozyme)
MIDREFLLDPNSHSPSDLSSAKSRPWLASPWPWTVAIAVLLGWGGVALWQSPWSKLKLPSFSSSVEIAPLVMEGGDPYLRALMRTISASEANTPQPYNVIYGGQHVQDLSEHPNRCVKIFMGPNRGNCSTASGRYQFLNTTWAEKASKYHPQPQKFLLWKNYSFEPEYQDQVLYRWLADNNAWGMDIAQQLRAGRLNHVLEHLSPTWTSLGYGIEDNVMTGRLPELYQKLLQEELLLAHHHHHD